MYKLQQHGAICSYLEPLSQTPPASLFKVGVRLHEACWGAILARRESGFVRMDTLRKLE